MFGDGLKTDVTMLSVENKSTRIYPYIILWVILAFVLSILYVELLGRYESYRDMMGTGLAGAYSLFIEFPIMLFLFLTVGGITSYVTWKREYQGWKIFLWSLVNILIIFAISFVYEVLKMPY